MPEQRWRDVGGPVGRLEPGPRNSITDVPGVRVGHAQAESGERTGVTVVAPPSLPALAGAQTVNGMGELTAWLEIEESGRAETPVYLCGTHALGTVYQAAIAASGHGPDEATIAVVGECDDGDMGDARTVTAGDVERALSALGPEVAEGTVGAGTGMSCYGYPGGIGTASRLVEGYTLGVLLLCNFGDRDYLDLLDHRTPGEAPEGGRGSCIAVCMSDAPLWPRQLRRLALRPLLGLARSGSYAQEGSGEIGIALSTSLGANLDNAQLDPFFAAAYEAAWEAVYNCLVAGRPAERRDGTVQEAFPIEEVRRRHIARSEP
jgi:D-aminopeptidase